MVIFVSSTLSGTVSRTTLVNVVGQRSPVAPDAALSSNPGAPGSAGLP